MSTAEDAQSTLAAKFEMLLHLLELFANIPESRKPRGLIFPLAFILAASLIAILGGAAYFRQIADQVADFPRELLGKLGGRWCHFLGRFRTPCDRTFRCVFECVDVERLEMEIGGGVKALLDTVATREGERVIVTMDAAHTQRDTAEHIAGTRGFDYIMNTKGNQPTLRATIATKTERYSDDLITQK
jgi:DDE_Tnp_1-associated